MPTVGEPPLIPLTDHVTAVLGLPVTVAVKGCVCTGCNMILPAQFVNEVRSGTECGIGVKNYNDVRAGDQIEVFERTVVARTI